MVNRIGVLRNIFKKCRNPKNTWVDLLALFLAAAAFIVSINPQVIPWNYDNFAKANAGDTYSQMFLAEHYYEIGDYEQAIYWYKLSSIEKSEFQPYAFNNLGYLYAKGFGLSEYETDGYRRFEIALNLFLKANQEGVEISNHNAKSLLTTYPKEYFPNTDYYELLELLMCDEPYVIRCLYEKTYIYKGVTFWENSKKYIYSGSSIESTPDKGTRTIYNYHVVIYDEYYKQAELRFVFLDEIE